MPSFADDDAQWVVAAHSIVAVVFGAGLMAVDLVWKRVDVERGFREAFAFVACTDPQRCRLKETFVESSEVGFLAEVTKES